MPIFSLLNVETRAVLSVYASDREAAVAKFGVQLERPLTLNEDHSVSPYMMRETIPDQPATLADYTISVFEAID